MSDTGTTYTDDNGITVNVGTPAPVAYNVSTSEGGNPFVSDDYIYGKVPVDFAPQSLRLAPGITPPPEEARLSREDVADHVWAMLFDEDFAREQANTGQLPTVFHVLKGAAAVRGAFTGAKAATGMGRLAGVARGVGRGLLKGAPLSSLLLSLTSDVNSDVEANRLDQFANKLAALLPPSAMYPSILSSMDMRALYAQVVPTGYTAERSTTVEVGGFTFDAGEVGWAAKALQVEEDNARVSATMLAPAELQGPELDAYVTATANAWRTHPNVVTFGPTTLAAMAQSATTPEEQAAVEEILVAATDPSTGVIAAAAPTVTPEGAPIPVDPAAAVDDDFVSPTGTIPGPAGVQPKWTQEEFDALIEQTRLDVAASSDPAAAMDKLTELERPQYLTDSAGNVLLYDENGNVTQDVVNGQPRIAIPARPTGVLSDLDPSAGLYGQRPLFYREALNYLHDKPREDVERMQAQLEKGGYLERDTYEKGYAWDTKTNDAWKSLLVDSFRQGKDAFTLVNERAAKFDYEARRALALGTNATDYTGSAFRFEQGRQADTDQQAARRRAAQPNDPAFLRSVANAYARPMIGRDLTPKELLQLGAFVGGLRRERVDEFVGSPVAPEERGSTVEPYFAVDENDVNRYVESNFTSEQRWAATRNRMQARQARFGGADAAKVDAARAAMNPGPVDA